jgi:NADPH:quinone reductase-like Zn-dependent oxidoreductase
LVSRVREITGGAGARIIFDPIGGSLLDKLADAAAPGATIFQYGWLSGEATPFPLIPALQKGLTIRGYWLWETVKNPETFARAKSYVYERVKHRDFQPKIAKTFRFEEVVEAYRYMESNEHTGKIVLTVD